MVKIELLELTETIARYKYFPESSDKCGIVMLDRKTGERVFKNVTKMLDQHKSRSVLSEVQSETIIDIKDYRE